MKTSDATAYDAARDIAELGPPADKMFLVIVALLVFGAVSADAPKAPQRRNFLSSCGGFANT